MAFGLILFGAVAILTGEPPRTWHATWEGAGLDPSRNFATGLGLVLIGFGVMSHCYFVWPMVRFLKGATRPAVALGALTTVVGVVFTFL